MTNEQSTVKELGLESASLKSVLNEIGAYVYMKDLNGCYTFANSLVQELFGFPLKHIIGKNDDHFFNLSRSNALRLNDRRVLDHGETIEKEEFNIIKATGETKYYWTVKKPLRNEAGEIIGMCGISTDITERKKEIEGRIQYEKEQKKVLVREVHHRIKNNLQGVASLLRQHAELNPSVRKHLEAAISQVFTMGVVHGIQGTSNEPGILLKEMIKEIISLVGNLTGKNIGFTKHDEFCHCVLSESEAVPMALIINELVMNACKHSPIDSSISIKEEHVNDDQSLTLIIENITDPLPEGFCIKEKKGLGAGLGLAVSLLPKNGASLNIYEENGTCFTRLNLSQPVIYKIDERNEDNISSENS